MAQHDEDPEIMVPSEASALALDAFEAKIQDRLTHPAFSNFGPVEVTAAEAMQWAAGWALEMPKTRTNKRTVFGIGGLVFGRTRKTISP